MGERKRIMSSQNTTTSHDATIPGGFFTLTLIIGSSFFVDSLVATTGDDIAVSDAGIGLGVADGKKVVVIAGVEAIGAKATEKFGSFVPPFDTDIDIDGDDDFVVVVGDNDNDGDGDGDDEDGGNARSVVAASGDTDVGDAINAASRDDDDGGDDADEVTASGSGVSVVSVLARFSITGEAVGIDGNVAATFDIVVT
jgi:hypothetical protein